MSTMSSLNISISMRRMLMLMHMMWLSSLAHKLLMLMLMLVSLVRTGLKQLYQWDLIGSLGLAGLIERTASDPQSGR